MCCVRLVVVFVTTAFVIGVRYCGVRYLFKIPVFVICSLLRVRYCGVRYRSVCCGVRYCGVRYLFVIAVFVIADSVLLARYSCNRYIGVRFCCVRRISELVNSGVLLLL